MAEKRFTVAVSGMTRTLWNDIKVAARKVNRTRSSFIVERMREIIEQENQAERGKAAAR